MDAGGRVTQEHLPGTPEAAVPASLRHRSRTSLRSAMYLHPCRQKKGLHGRPG